MDFRFYLINESTGVQTEIEEPVNFDSFKPILRRDSKFHGVNFEFSEQPLGFYGKAYKLVTDVYNAFGIDGVLIFLVEYNCNGEWREFYKGTLDYAQYEEVTGDGCIVNVGIAQLGVPMTLKNRMETKVDLDTLSGFEGATLPAYSNLGKTMSIPSKGILLMDTANVKERIDYSGTNQNSNTTDINFYVYKVPFGDILGNVEFGTFNPETEVVLNYKYISNNINTPLDYSQGVKNAIFVNDTGVERKINIKFQLNGFTYGGGSTTGFTHRGFSKLIVSIFNEKNERIENLLERDLDGSTIDFEHEKLLDAGHKVGIYIIMCNFYTNNNSGSVSNSNFSISVLAGTHIDISYLDKTTPTTSKIYMLHEALSRIAEVTTNNSLTVKSNYYGRKDSQINPTQADGVGSLRCITNGYFLRKAILTSGNPVVYISLKDILDGLNAIDAIGYSIEDDKLRIEPWEYFYTNDVILRCDDITEIKRKIDVSRCFSLFDIGYNKWESEEWNSIDGFHGKRQYRTKLKNTDTKSEQLCKLIADSYAIEATKRAGILKTGEKKREILKDWKYDNDIFVLDLIRDSNNIVVNTGNGDAGTLIDHSTVFNIDLSPARMAARWFGWIMQGVNPLAGDQLIFTSAEGYADAITTSKHAGSVANSEVLERQNWEAAVIINRNPIPKFKPELVEFEYPLTAAEFIAIRNNPSGLIEFNGEQGWIKEIEADLLEGTAKFTLIPILRYIPPPLEYEFEFADGTTETEHTIQYDETFIDAIISTKGGNPTAFTVLSKPAWATVTINGSIATVTSSNGGEYREGQIVYQQTETGSTIVSKIKQSALPPLSLFVIVGNGYIMYTNNGGQTWI
jgi:hypothetical protein